MMKKNTTLLLIVLLISLLPIITVRADHIDGVSCTIQQVNPIQWLVSCTESSPTPTPTVTQVIPTSTPHVHITPTGLPVHDGSMWHNLVGYDHEHGDDPSLVNDLFGRLGEEWNGNGIDHPFHTGIEHNEFKHRTHKITVRRDNDCISLFGAVNCVKAFRTLQHLDFFAMTTRFHSFFIEGMICRVEDPTDCGTFARGGHLDLGPLINQAGGVETRVPIPADNIPFPLNTCGDTGRRFHNSAGRFATWYGDQHGSNNCIPEQFRASNIPLGYIQIGVLIEDSWALLNVNDPANPVITCPDGSCTYNSSHREQGHLVAGEFNPALDFIDGNPDGYITLSGFTDVYGWLAPLCTAAGPNCVPFELVHVPLGRYQYRDYWQGIKPLEYDTLEDVITYPN